jgi:hypothetical protein
MTDANTDVIQGTLDMLILKTLSLEPMHGFGIARRVEQVSRGVFKMNPGSLLTALQRLRVAEDRERPPRQVLHPHASRQKTAGERDRRLGAPRLRHRAAAEGRSLRCLFGGS